MACQQALITPSHHGKSPIPLDDDFWITITRLADDPIVGVRIGIARLVGFISGKMKLLYFSYQTI